MKRSTIVMSQPKRVKPKLRDADQVLMNHTILRIERTVAVRCCVGQATLGAGSVVGSDSV